MPRYAVLGNDDSTVVNIVLATPEYAVTQSHWVPATDDCMLLSKWDGTAFTPPPPFVPPVPDEVPMANARVVLRRAGITAQMVIDAITQNITDPLARDEALIDFEYQPVMRRKSPLVAALAPAMNLTPDQVDDMFRQAALL